MSEHSVARGQLGAASISPRPAAAAALVAAATAAATSIGTDIGADLRPTAAQIAAAVGIAALSLAVVSVAATTRAHMIAVSVALLSAGAATIHFAAAGSHFQEWWGFGAFFFVSGLAQLVWAVLAVSSPSPRVLWAGVLGNAAILILWIVTRTAGTFVGPDAHTPESVGVPDAVASSLEVSIILTCVWSATLRPSSQKLVWIVRGVTLVLTTLALLSVMGAAGDVIPPMG
jgi:hypothetical protein